MAAGTVRRLGALFTTSKGTGRSDWQLPGASREYAIVTRGAADSALAAYGRLTLAELPLGEAVAWSAVGGGEPPAWACYELVFFDASEESNLLDHDHLYLVFSGPPEGVSPNEYDDFYHEHMRENLLQESFTGGWRWRASAIRPPADGRLPGPHLAIYRMERDWASTQMGIAAHTQKLSGSWPDWFKRIQFCSLEATAVGPLQR